MTQLDPTDTAAMEMQEDFQALIKKYKDRDVVIRAVTGILATTAYAASNNSPDEARKLLEAIVAEAFEAIHDMYETEKASKKEA
jgi:vesicle coat complex subunit